MACGPMFNTMTVVKPNYPVFWNILLMSGLRGERLEYDNPGDYSKYWLNSPLFSYLNVSPENPVITEHKSVKEKPRRFGGKLREFGVGHRRNCYSTSRWWWRWWWWWWWWWWWRWWSHWAEIIITCSDNLTWVLVSIIVAAHTHGGRRCPPNYPGLCSQPPQVRVPAPSFILLLNIIGVENGRVSPMTRLCHRPSRLLIATGQFWHKSLASVMFHTIHLINSVDMYVRLLGGRRRRMG